jgi:integrase
MPKQAAVKLTEARVSRLPAAPEGTRTETPDALAPGLVIRVNGAGRKDWQVRYRLHGRSLRVALGTWPAVTLAEARRRAREVREQAEAGVDPKAAAEAEAAAERAAAETFEALAEQFLAEWSPRGQNTHRDTAATIRLHLAPLHPVRLIDLHRSQLGDVVAALRNPRRKGGPKPGAARNAYEAARRITSWAVRRGKLEHDPFDRMEPPPKGAPRERVLSEDELRLLWPVFRQAGYPFGHLARFLALTGARRAEGSEMTWSELDCPAEPTVWTIPSERSKNGTAHVVPLSPQARAVLAEVPRGAGPFVFSSTDGMRPVSGFTTAKRRFDRLALEAARAEGVEPPTAWSFHDLRRTCRTGLARLGVPREVAERAIGHVGGSVLERAYDKHRYEAEVADALEAWGREVERITSSFQVLA